MATAKEVAQARREAKYLASLFGSLIPVLAELDEVSGFAKTVTVLQQAAGQAKTDEASARALVDAAKEEAAETQRKGQETADAIIQAAKGVKADADKLKADAKQTLSEANERARSIIADGSAKASAAIDAVQGRILALQTDEDTAKARLSTMNADVAAAEERLAAAKGALAELKKLAG